MPSNYLSCPLLLSEARFIDTSHISDYIEYFVDRGYAASTIRHYLGAVLHFESWRRKLCHSPTLDIRSDVSVFVDRHLCQCQCPPSFPRSKKSAKTALAHWLPIRDPQWVNPELQSTHAQLIDSYDPYMTAVVGLTPSTRIYRRRYAAEFLDWILVQEIALSQLSDLQLSHYIVAKCDVNGVTNKTNQRSISIKSFINFLVSEGESTVAWTSFISRPKVPYNIATTQPLTDGELSHLLKAFDRTQPAGKRDYAMARCLIDLGVRTSDVAGFNLDHIDWR